MRIFRTITLLAMIFPASLFAKTDLPTHKASVSSALEKLKTHPAAKISQQAGWTIISIKDHDNQFIWFFSPEIHAAHPAVIKRTILKKEQGIEISTETFCESSKKNCDSLAQQFKKLDKNIK